MTHKDFTQDLAKQAGEIITKYFFIDHQREAKEDQSPVTLADKEINEVVRTVVQKQYPDHGFIGEEGGNFNKDAEYKWVCDPLDGTIPFTHGLPACAFSLALVRDGEPVAGVVYTPFSKRLYYAEKGAGSFLNDKPIHVNDTDSLRRAFVGMVLWDNATYDIRETFSRLYDMGFDFQTGSTAYLGALVANGDAVANIFPYHNPWDMAAVKIIVEEAGGRVTDLFGKEQRYDQKTNGALVSNGVVHQQLLDIIKETAKQQ